MKRHEEPVTMENSSVDGHPFNAKHTPSFWATLQFAEAWIDPGPSPAMNDGPYLKVPSIAYEGGTVHRIYARRSRKHGPPTRIEQRDGVWWRVWDA